MHIQLLFVKILLVFKLKNDTVSTSVYSLKYIISKISGELEQSIAECSGTLRMSSITAAVIPTIPEVSEDHMCAILSHLDAVFQKAVRVAFPDHTAPVNVPIQISRVADYQCNVAMALAKVCKILMLDVFSRFYVLAWLH